MSASDAPENLAALKRAADQGLPDASRPSSGPFYRGGNLGDYLHPKKADPTSHDSNDSLPSVSPLEKFLKPAQDTIPHEGTPPDRKGLEGYIDNAQ
jgi:hypothetical protein